MPLELTRRKAVVLIIRSGLVATIPHDGELSLDHACTSFIRTRTFGRSLLCFLPGWILDTLMGVFTSSFMSDVEKAFTANLVAQ